MSLNFYRPEKNGRTAKFLTGVFALTFMLSMTVQPLVFNVLAATTPSPSWPTSWTIPAQCSTDPSDESPSEADILGDATHSAAGFSSDSNFLYYRERIEGNPKDSHGNFKNTAWVVLLQTLSPKYQFLASIDGDHNQVNLYKNTTLGADVDFSPLFSDTPETLLWNGSGSTYARTSATGDGAYYVDWAVPVAGFPSGSGVTVNTTKFFATSQDGSNYNKDHLDCYEQIADLSVSKTVNHSTANVGDSLTYTVTVTNTGPDTASSVTVSDLVPSGVTYVSSTPSQGTYNSGTGLWTVGSIALNVSKTITINVTVNNGTGGNTITNIATTTSATLDNDSSDNSSSASTAINSVPTSGNLTVTKVVTNDNGGTAQVSDFTLRVGTTTVTSGTTNIFLAGSYVVSETGGPSGYVGTISGDCDLNGNITIVAANSYSCTVTNNDAQPKLTVTKVVINDDVNHPGTSQVSDFHLTVGSTSVTSGVQVGIDAGTYQVAENGPTGYNATYSGNCDSTGSITLLPGDVKSCTITNDDVDTLADPTITVVKTVTNDDGGQATVSSFTYTIDGVLVTQGVPVVVTAGSHTVAETGLSGYTASDWGTNCNADGTITVVAGQTYVCSITNDDQPGTLIVKKVIIGNESANADDFSFVVNNGEAISFEADAQNDLTVDAGTYSVTEPTVTNYDTTYDNCSGVSVANGGSATCTVTNTYNPPIIDACSNIDGNQSVVPDGYQQNQDGTCTQPETSPTPVTLTVTISNNEGDGEGTVTDNQNKLNCDSLLPESTCTATYNAGTEVTLTATPHEGSSFEGSWINGAGTCTGNTTPCTITVGSNTTLSAHFSVAPTNTTPPTTTGGGGGSGGTLTPYVPNSTPAPEVLGASTTPASPVAPEVLGATTTLPSTGFSWSDSIVMSLFSAMVMTGMMMMFIGFGFVPKKIEDYLN